MSEYVIFPCFKLKVSISLLAEECNINTNIWQAKNHRDVDAFLYIKTAYPHFWSGFYFCGLEPIYIIPTVNI